MLHRRPYAGAGLSGPPRISAIGTNAPIGTTLTNTFVPIGYMNPRTDRG